MQPVIAKAPKAKKIPFTHTYHNQNFTDNYYWLREKETKEVIDYLQEENEYTQAILKDTEELQQQLFEEIKARIKEDDESVPVFEDGYYYYTKVQEGKDFAIHCRKKEHLEAEEELLLDENILAEDQEYFSLGEFSVSPNNDLLAYSIDVDGSELYTIFIKNLNTGELYTHSIPNTYYGLEWSNDNRHLYYTVLDDSHRPYQLWKHDITKEHNDVLVFEELDTAYFLDVGKTKDQQYIVINLGSQITSEVWFIDSSDATSTPQIIAQREVGVEYEVDHLSGYFHILTNADKAKNFKWVKTKVSTPQRKHWQDVLAYDEHHYLLSLEPFQDHFVLEERVEGMQQIRVISADFSQQHTIKFDEAAYSVRLGNNPESSTSKLRLHYRSLVTPNTVYDYDMNSQQLETLKVQDIPSGYNKEEYTTERKIVKAEDGALIPVSLVYKTSLKRPEGNPLYLYAYGSYGITVDPFFSVSHLSLINRGFVFAIAHIRGGSDKGRQWYEDGKFLHKKNTFLDFIAVANYFIDKKWTTANLLVANGGSAGGLLMGAVANIAGELFNCIVADVPFVDVINTMMDDSIPLTVIEYDEWGNPNLKVYFDYMRSYSPYDNVEQKNYPNMLVTAGLNDPRVQYWEPAKWVAKLRELKTDHNTLLLKTNMDAGHSGVSGRFEKVKETAFEYAFILKHLPLYPLI